MPDRVAACPVEDENGSGRRPAAEVDGPSHVDAEPRAGAAPAEALPCRREPAGAATGAASGRASAGRGKGRPHGSTQAAAAGSLPALRLRFLPGGAAITAATGAAGVNAAGVDAAVGVGAVGAGAAGARLETVAFPTARRFFLHPADSRAAAVLAAADLPPFWPCVPAPAVAAVGPAVRTSLAVVTAVCASASASKSSSSSSGGKSAAAAWTPPPVGPAHPPRHRR